MSRLLLSFLVSLRGPVREWTLLSVGFRCDVTTTLPLNPRGTSDTFHDPRRKMVWGDLGRQTGRSVVAQEPLTVTY